jgi:hypothetical protein
MFTLPVSLMSGSAVAASPATILGAGVQRAWWKAGHVNNTLVDDGGTSRASVIDNLFGNATYDASQGTMGNRASYSATAFRGAYPGFTFDRARSDAYTFGASPGGSYTAWALLTLTAHTSNQRLLSDADAGVNHFVFFTSTEAMRINSATSYTTTTTGIATAMIRWSYNSADGAVTVSINNAADLTGTITSGISPAMDTLGAAAATPISMVLSELVIATAVYAGGSTEATAMAAYFAAGAAAGLW